MNKNQTIVAAVAVALVGTASAVYLQKTKLRRKAKRIIRKVNEAGLPMEALRHVVQQEMDSLKNNPKI